MIREGSVPRHRVTWRLVGQKATKSHAVLVIERGRLAWDTLCGRPSQGSILDREGRPECGKCSSLLEPVRQRLAA